MRDPWVIIKRGLFYRPNNCGYTGIRDHAGHYTECEARAEMSCAGITAMPLADAPEFSEACFEDLARKHLTMLRDDALADLESARSEIARLREALKTASAELDALRPLTSTPWAENVKRGIDSALSPKE